MTRMAGEAVEVSDHIRSAVLSQGSLIRGKKMQVVVKVELIRGGRQVGTQEASANRSNEELKSITSVEIVVSSAAIKTCRHIQIVTSSSQCLATRFRAQKQPESEIFTKTQPRMQTWHISTPSKCNYQNSRTAEYRTTTFSRMVRICSRQPPLTLRKKTRVS